MVLDLLAKLFCVWRLVQRIVNIGEERNDLVQCIVFVD